MPKFGGNRDKQNSRRGSNGYSSRRQKNPFDPNNGEYIQRHTKKPKKGKVRYSKNTKQQKSMNKQFKKIVKALGLRPSREHGTGVDVYIDFKRHGKKFSIPIDFKFAFGMHFGEEHIKARVTPKESGKRRLINKSKWMFAADADGQLHVFRTSVLDKYIKENYGNIKKSDQIDKLNYVELPINLSDMLYLTKSKSFVLPFNQRGVKYAARFIADIEAGPIQKAPKRTKANETKSGNGYSKLNNRQKSDKQKRSRKGRSNRDQRFD